MSKKHFTGVKCSTCGNHFSNKGYNHWGNYSIRCPHCGDINVVLGNKEDVFDDSSYSISEIIVYSFSLISVLFLFLLVVKGFIMIYFPGEL